MVLDHSVMNRIFYYFVGIAPNKNLHLQFQRKKICKKLFFVLISRNVLLKSSFVSKEFLETCSGWNNLQRLVCTTILIWSTSRFSVNQEVRKRRLRGITGRKFKSDTEIFDWNIKCRWVPLEKVWKQREWCIN